MSGKGSPSEQIWVPIPSTLNEEEWSIEEMELGVFQYIYRKAPVPAIYNHYPIPLKKTSRDGP